MKKFLLTDRKGNAINSNINRPPYRGCKYPTFIEVQSVAFNYRSHGEKVYIKPLND
jgi:hypothetical protein